MQRGLDLSAVRAVAASRGGVVGAAKLDHLARVVLDHVHAGDEVRVSQSHLAPRRHAEELARRVFHEVLPLDVQLAGEGHLASPGLWVFGVIDRVELLDLALGIIGDDYLERVQHSQHSRACLVEVFAQAVIEQGDVHGADELRHADALHEVADGLGRVAAPPQAR